MPIIDLARAIRIDPEIILLSDDPATLADLAAWSRMTGNSYEILGPNKYLIKRL